MKRILNNFLYGFSGILKNLPDAIFIVEKTGQINWVNKQATVIYNTTKNNLINANFNDIVDNGLEKIDNAIKSKNPIIAGAFSYDSKDFFIELNAKLHFGKFLVTIRDITAITNALTNAEQTIQFNKEKNAMLVKLANEFKSPINSIIGFSQALIDGVGGEINEKQDKYVKIINKSSKDFLYFIDKFIEFSHAESTLYQYDYQTFDIVNSIQNIIKNNEEIISEKGLLVDIDTEEWNKKAIYSDEKTLKIILQNLFASSIRLTDTGSITFKISYPDQDLIDKIGIFKDMPEKSLIMISISDTGIGIQENEMNSLFDPYDEIEKENKKNIVRALNLGAASILTKRLNGFVWVESEIMKGTNFNLIIPAEKDLNE